MRLPVVHLVVAVVATGWCVADARATRADDLLAALRRGPMAGVEEIVFAVRQPGWEHWYANFSYYAENDQRLAYRDGGRLCRLNLDSGRVTVLLDDPKGGVRDPAVHYDAQKILFSYRPGGTKHYHLYEIGVDGRGLVQLTDGPYDDIEPCYLPDGRIVFVSSRCRRWVNCWLTQVATLHRCDAQGRNIVPLSSNNEHDNTPWVLPGGQILYTRWEYVDRSQVSFHHLWTANPDGTRQTVFYGNQRPETVMIDARPVPGSEKIVASFSPGHGYAEHRGRIALVDPRRGPDAAESVRMIRQDPEFRDPWAFSESAFMAARRGALVVLDDRGRQETIYRTSAADKQQGLECHEPRPLVKRPRERLVAEAADWRADSGRVVLVNAYHGRNMDGVLPGEIKKLLVLETLPKPINYTGGMEPLSYGGTFTLERVLGTVPVESDGSAYVELPALRSFFLVALDANDRSVKRMQSFMTVMPGETTTCIGCHEPRTLAPQYRPSDVLAMRRPPSRVEPVAGVPDVFDFPRDVQPILDKHCVECHDYTPGKRGGPRDGGVILCGDRGPMYSHSYAAITIRRLVADGRNALGNRAPRAIGSSASRLLELADQHHGGAALDEREMKVLRLWIDSGAAYPGTYAALGSGMIGGYAENRQDKSALDWPSTEAAAASIHRRCGQCHVGPRQIPPNVISEIGKVPREGPEAKELRRHFVRHLVYNLSRPEMSLVLLAPLAKAAGGYELCGKPVFADRRDADYATVRRAIAEAKAKLDEITRFDMPHFRPPPPYLREMRRYGILAADAPDDAPVDVYELDRAYWRSLWYRAPQGR